MKFISSKAHTIIGLIAGVVLIISPWLFGFANVGGPAIVVPFVIGVLGILSELTTASPLSPVKLIPMKIHLVVDVLMGLFLMLSPWSFSFYAHPAAVWIPHFLMGLLMMGYALATNPADVRVSVAANRTHTAH